MGNVSVKDGDGGSDAELLEATMHRSTSSNMAMDFFPMASTPPEASTSITTPQIPLHDVNEPWSYQLQSSTERDSPTVDTIATMIEWNHGGNDVCVEGSWDNWSRRCPLHKASKGFFLVQLLPAGIYHYRFLVNGQRRHSPDLPFTHDGNGNAINVLDVQSYVPEILDGVADFDVPDSPDSAYDSPFPGAEDCTKDPPLLPPQLHLNTHILNIMPSPNAGALVDTSVGHPQHVVLNHLFVGAVTSTPVLALGFTQRFRTKYITVILHKPLHT